eukprot:TRINITY_DN1742_c0_g1_i1.p1 TRINITY_DN1742_c0_g1~~TRINITY_DN1742_c0_g1_i1.p1  ORF type:complete len:224 (+),score=41.59 TRINITY_DN1742_c0_g1_i1:226-897(+)
MPPNNTAMDTGFSFPTSQPTKVAPTDTAILRPAAAHVLKQRVPGGTTPQCEFTEDNEQCKASRKKSIVAFVTATLKHLMKATPEIDNAQYPSFQNEPKIDLAVYLRNILYVTKIDPSMLLAGVMYIEDIQHYHSELVISSHNAHRLIFSATMLACKVWLDNPKANVAWAKISGSYTIEQLNKMELELLHLLGWNTYVSKEEFARYEEASKIFSTQEAQVAPVA